MRTKLIIAAAAVLAGGCSLFKGSQPEGRNRDSVDWNQVAETSKEPAIDAETRFAAGQLAETQGYPQRAIEQYQETVRINPKHQLALYRLGVLYTQSAQFEQATAAWNQYVAATDGSAAAYSNLGFCYEHAGDLKRAEESYLKGIQKDGFHQPSRVNYGLLLARTKREAQAVEQLSAVLPPAEVHYNMASVYDQIGRRAEARAEYEKALKLDPQMWEAEVRLSKLE